MSDVLEAAGAGADAVPVDDAFLLERGIDSRALPLWFSGPDMTALMRADVSRALAAGLAFRPLAETVRATVAEAEPVDGVGLAPEREAALLAEWRARV
jgi:2'-hydroxyisoflavone reductase